MFEHTEANHYCYRWDGKPFALPQTPASEFRVSFGSVRRTPGSFREECVQAARKIAERATQPIAVALSGGLDSEIVARSFKEAGVPFYCLTLRYQNGLNEHDILYAREYCQEHQVRLELFDLDVEKFWEKDLWDYCHRYGVYSTHRPVMMWLADQVSDCLVIGGGDLKIHRRTGTPGHFISESSDSAAQVTAAHLRHREVVSRFFVYTPELMLSFLRNREVREFCQASRAMRLLNLKKYKPYVLRQLWPDLQVRAKYHGFELRESLDFGLRERLQTELEGRWPSKAVRFEVNELAQTLEGASHEEPTHPLC